MTTVSRRQMLAGLSATVVPAASAAVPARAGNGAATRRSPALRTPTVSSALGASIRSLAAKAVRAGRLPALGLAVACDGAWIIDECFGLKDPWRRIPAGPGTRFRTGSISKMLTSGLVGRMVEHGVLDLDAPVSGPLGYEPFAEPMTMRQLLSHTAGLPAWTKGDTELFNFVHWRDARDATRALAGRPLQSRPGARFRYSTLNWTVASAVIESLGRQPFDHMMDAMFADLGLTGTAVERIAVPDQALALPTFYTGEERAWRPAWLIDNSGMVAGAGIASTPADLVRYIRAMQDGTAVRRSTFDMLRTPFAPAAADSLPADHRFGLGWINRVHAGTAVYGHEGNNNGSIAFVWSGVDRDIQVAAMTNIWFEQFQQRPAGYAREKEPFWSLAPQIIEMVARS